MKPDHDFSTRLKALSAHLSEIPEVQRLDSSEEKGAWALAYHLLELEGSYRKFLDEELPRLRDSLDAKQKREALAEIGEGLRHVLYHLKKNQYFDYLE